MGVSAEEELAREIDSLKRDLSSLREKEAESNRQWQQTAQELRDRAKLLSERYATYTDTLND